MYHTNKLEDMLSEGYSKKWAQYFLLGIEQDNQMGVFEEEYAKWAHSQGFFATHAYAYGLNENNVDNYLSDYDYYKVWPLNSWSRIWINDKLTLKYMLHGTEYSHLMPKYYFYSTPSGLKPLMDVDMSTHASIEDAFFDTLHRVGELACKPNNGTESRGFVRISIENGSYCFNGAKCDKDQILTFLQDNPNYIFTEYLRPSDEFKKFSDQIHTLRIVTINENGYSPKIVASFLRFPNSTCGEANYNVFETDIESKYNHYTYIDINDGSLEKSIKTYVSHIESTDIHPDTKETLVGELPHYDELVKEIEGICRLMSNVEYMGFDFGVTNDGYKLMEINSHPGINTSQTREPFFLNETIGQFFKNKLEDLNNLSEEEKKKRTLLVR